MNDTVTYWVNRIVLPAMVITAVAFSSLGAAERERRDSQQLLQSGILKHRVSIMTVLPAGGVEGDYDFIIRTEAWKTLLLKEGIAVSQEEWAGAVDILHAEVSLSNIFRPLHDRLGWTQGDERNAAMTKYKDPPLIMLAKFGVGAQGRGIFIYLIDRISGATVFTSESWEPSMKEAIKKAVSELGEKTSVLAWRCLVTNRTDHAMIIDRGRLDGVRKNQTFVGYSLSQKQIETSLIDMEFQLMRHGTRTGVYVVTEEGQEFSKVAPVDNAPMLGADDILEIPAIALQDREPNTRGRKIWDKIYK